MPGWSSRAAASASRCARSGTGPGAGTTFIATSRSRRSSRAAKTVPNPPEPSRSPEPVTPQDERAADCGLKLLRGVHPEALRRPRAGTFPRCRRTGWYYWGPQKGRPGAADGAAPRGDELQALSFFDEDDEPRRTTPRPRRGRTSGGGVATDSQTLMIRRAVAAGLGVLILVLLVFAIKSCRDSAHENALRDYNRQISAIGNDSARAGRRPVLPAADRGRRAAGSADEHLQLPRAGRAAVRPGGAARRPERHEGRPAVGADRARVAARRAREDRQPRSAPRSATRARRPTPRSRASPGRCRSSSPPTWPGRRASSRSSRTRSTSAAWPASRSAAPQFLPDLDWVQPTDDRQRARPAAHLGRERRQRRSRPAPACTAPASTRRPTATRRSSPARPTGSPTAEPAVHRQVHQPGRERRVRHQGHAADLGRERQPDHAVQDGPEARARRSRPRWSCRSTASRRSAPP